MLKCTLPNFASNLEDYRQLHLEVTPDIQDLLNIVDKSRTSSFAWKGQFSPQLIEFLLSQYPSAKSILDPFCGSGTVIYESLLHSKTKICGTDINPAAIIFAKFSEYSSYSLTERKQLFLKSVNEIIQKIDKDIYPEVIIDTTILNHFKDNHLVQCILLHAFKDKNEVKIEKIFKSISYVEKRLLQLPFSTTTTFNVVEGDSRLLPFNNADFDLIITSPPYINVFNYHHNYRKSVEALGVLPLVIAKSEIGANRKFRANRFNIVTQYCIDIALSLFEMHRVTKYKKNIILIVGTLSTVRGKQFYNGEIIFLLALLLKCFKLNNKYEREFKNRYGYTIKEEIITFNNRKFKEIEKSRIIEIGRNVAKFVLNNALTSTNKDDKIFDEIEEAIKNIKNINPGEFIMKN